MKKILFVVIDGLPDEKIPQLGNKTPLEAAKKPNLDRFAKQGFCGYFKPLFSGKTPWSEEGHFTLFGYDPKKHLPGRGVLEALGTNIKLLPNDVALRANFATVDSQGKIIDRRAGRIKTKEAMIFAKHLNGLVVDKTRFLVKPILSHRLTIIMRGSAETRLSEKITDSDPEKTGKKEKKVFAKTNEAEYTAEVLNKFLKKTEEILASHPLNEKRKKAGLPMVNCVLTRKAGKLKNIKTFQEKWGLKAACLSNGPLYRGIGKYLGMTLLPERKNSIPSVSPDYIKNKFLAARKALEKFDFVFCHIKDCDSLAEDGNFLAKKKFIEIIDKKLSILDNLNSALLVITADHGTSSLKKSHIACAIPFLIYSPEKHFADNSVEGFTEKSCQKNKEINGLKIMPLILKTALKLNH